MDFYSNANSVQRIFAMIDIHERGLTHLSEPAYIKSALNVHDDPTKEMILNFFRRELKTAKSEVIHAHGDIYYSRKYFIRVVSVRADTPTMHIYVYKREDMDYFIVQDVLSHADTKVSNSEAVKALQDLWLYQFNKTRSEQDRLHMTDTNVAIQTSFLNYLQTSLDNTRAQATVGQVANFYLHFHADTLSRDDDDALNWLVRQSVVDTTDLIELEWRDLPDAERESIINVFNSNGRFTNKQRVVDVFAIGVPDDALMHDTSYEHIKGVHGTNNQSVLSILQYGLKNLKTLEELQSKVDGIVAHTKGEGLGRGVYFARPEQAQKSAMYQSGDEYGFMFYADIAYKTSETVSKYVGSGHQTDADLVIGDRVGSGGIDELVAKRDELITLQYVIVTKKV